MSEWYRGFWIGGLTATWGWCVVDLILAAARGGR